MNLEREIRKLENEVKALKVTFEKMAIQMPVFTNSISFSTTQNACTINISGTSYSLDGIERVVVTFATDTGANTLATLEMTTNNDSSDLKVFRVPYSGGARWVVYCGPNYDSSGNWKTTTYNFTVQSAVDGTLGAKMIWQ